MHKGEKRIKLIFPFDNETISAVKKIPGCRWSETLRCWHVPASGTSLKNLEQNGLLPINKPFLKTIEEKQVPENHKALFKKFDDYMRYRRYSENTLRVYVSMLKIFFQHLDYPQPQDITREDIIAFNRDYTLKNNFSFNYQNQMISALKLFFGKIEKKN